MENTYTAEQLNNFSKQELIVLLLSQQEQISRLNENIETLIEQIRISNQQRFGRHTEKLSDIAGQLSFFNEAEQLSEELPDEWAEPDPDELLPPKPKKKKQTGKRDADLKDFPREIHGFFRKCWC